MAEKVLFNIAGGILSSLASPLVAKEIRLLLGVEGELEKLMVTVLTIKAVLLDAEEKSQSQAVSLWLERLSDVLYEADDFLDVVSTEVGRRKIMTLDKKVKKVCIFFPKSNHLTFRRKMGYKIKVIKEKLDNIKADRDFHLERHLEEPPVRVTGRDDTNSFIPKQHVIGRENDMEEVLRSLLDTNIEESLSILPIVGMGGLGKTTLAQLIFNDERIQNFDLKRWVCVSNNFDVRIIVEKILKFANMKPEGFPTKQLLDQLRKEQLVDRSQIEQTIDRFPMKQRTDHREKEKLVDYLEKELLDCLRMEQLVDCLRKEIVRKFFFLVLDDVWNQDCDKWFELKELLTNDIVGNKILVTTRSNEVARITHTIEPYMLRGLGEEESWDLFKKMAFIGEEIENLSITQIGKEIVKKCGGIPLALGAIGRMLSDKDSVEEWMAFRDNQLSKVSETTILPTLKLSYDVLPSYLKHCFVYSSLFPKDYDFNKSMLIRLWIAQGFVKSQQNRCLEDIGHDYFMNLVSRLFFQKDNFEEDSNIFKMHDLMHDLAISMSRSLIITKFDNKRENAIQKVRHISFHVFNNISSLHEATRTRTLINFKGWGAYDLDFGKVFSHLKLLRVLILGKYSFGLNYIGRLKYLRYLDLSDLKISKLPNSIKRLINLETLILSGCNNLKKLPKGISKLVNLRHLENLDCYKCNLPHEIVRLTNLQTLRSFVVTWDSSSKHNIEIEELIGLKNLRGKLQIYDAKCGVYGTTCESRTIVDSEVKSIFNVLKLEGQDLYYQNPPGSRPLNFLSLLTTLVTLTINKVLRCEYLPSLCQLPSLKEVHLCNLRALEYILGYSDKDQLSSSTVS